MSASIELNNKQKQHLKSLAHPLKPVVLMGQHGLTEGVIAEIDGALEHHELIKVKVPADERDVRIAVADAICRETRATLVQSIGKTLVIYRPAQEPVIKLPR